MVGKLTERTLKGWRKEALQTNVASEISLHKGNDTVIRRLHRIATLEERIIRLTQELLDNHLLNKE